MRAIRKPDGEDCDDGFCFEDLTEDEEALAAEAEVEVKQVKGPSGAIKGVLKDSTSGSPLIGASIRIPKSKYSAETNINGEYTLNAPPGTYTLNIVADGYKPTTLDNVKVEQDKEIKINEELQPFGALTVVVEGEINTESAAGKLVERKKAATAKDVMSREDISKSGGGSTSSVARRIVGSTVVGGKYLFVRGLGHRYGNTLFDGARVPSPDPNIRSVPLDIFPSSALGAINIQKTAMPDVPADFTGASAQLETRNTPDEFTWELGADVGFNTATTFRDGLRDVHYAGDRVAFGNIARQLPASFDTPVRIDHTYQDQAGNNVWTNEQIRDFGRNMTTTETAIYPKTPLPNFGVKGMIGGTAHPWGTDLGMLAAVGYGFATQSVRPSSIKVLLAGNCPPGYTAGMGPCEKTAQPRTIYENSLKTTQTAGWTSLGLMKWRLNEHHKLALSLMYTRDADKESRRLGGFVPGGVSRVPASGQATATNTRLRYQMRSILFTRLGGKHEFPKAKDFTIDWFGSYAQARQDDPLLREMQFFEPIEGSGDFRIDNNESAKFQFMKMLDNTSTGALNFTAPFQQWSKLDSKFKFGGWAEGKWRTFNSRTFRYTVQPTATPGFNTGNILNSQSIGGPDDTDTTFFIRERTLANDQYDGTQEIYAGYAMMELPFVRWFKVAGGVRFEANQIVVEPFDFFTGAVEEDDRAELQDYELLPSAALIFPVRNDMNVRLAGYKTVARPEMRELATFRFTDFVGGFDVVGEPNLISSKIWNADLRWEWFPSANEVIAISGFYKEFIDPIEAYVVSTSAPTQSYQNAKGARNAGGELELRKNLEFIAKPLKDLSVGFNFAYIYSRVQTRTNEELDALGQPRAGASNFDRALQGQSPFVVNAYLSYDNEGSGTSLRALYNTFGRRIEYFGANGLDDIYLQPVHTLDFVADQRLYKGLHFDFKVLNILNWAKEHRQFDETVFFERKGVTFVLGLTYKH